MPRYRVELSDGRKFEVEADAPPSEQDILAHLGGQQKAASPKPEPSTTDRVLADNAALPPLVRAGQAIGRFVKGNPAQAGAMAGGALAGPFTGGLSIPAAMAAIGGASALGAGAGQLASGHAPSLGTMAKEGAIGATGQGVGRAVTGAARLVAKPLAKGVLKLSKSLQGEYGGDDLLSTFFKEGIPVGQSAEAGKRAMASAAEAKGMAQNAMAQGAPAVGAREIVKEFRPLRDEVQKRMANAAPNAEAEMREIVQRAQGLKRAGAQDVVANQGLKQQAQSDASKAFRAADRGAPINDTTAKLDKAVAVGRQKAAEARIPGIKDQNRNTQQLMGLEEALQDTERRSPGFMGTNPMTWLGAVAPSTGSRVALGANKLAEMPIPGGARNALLLLSALLTGEQE